MIKFGVLSGGLILCGVLVNPCFAPQAVQELGLHEFCRSLSVGYGEEKFADAFTSAKPKGPYVSKSVNRSSYASVTRPSYTHKL
jgi:hypothetical protein